MADWFKINFESIISIIAIIISFIAVIYSRRNLKTQKYIETITVQRISWIESLRKDLSDVVSGLNLLGFCDNQFRALDVIIDIVGFDDRESEESAYEYRDNLKKFKGKLDAELTRIDLVKKIDLSILRLNQKDDLILITKLEEIKEYILHENYDVCIKGGYIKELKLQIAETLKMEWEKVKLEVRSGKMKNDSRKRT